MGAWGTGLFEDDTSQDLVSDVLDTDAKSFVKNSSAYACADYLDYDQCQEIIISGVILDSILNDSQYEVPDEAFYEWISTQDSEGLDALKGDIISGLKLVISEKSELNELWQENEEDYPAWKKNIENLIANLSG